MDPIAQRFVDLTLKYPHWDKIREFPAEETQILLETVTTAGFEAKAVVPGKLVGNYRERDGSPTGETYPINGYSPFKVIGHHYEDLYHATGWLDNLLFYIRRKARDETVLEELVKIAQTEIERSIPLEPIQLTPEGDFLLEYPPPAPTSGYFVDHTRDGRKLDSCVGVHKYCGGWMDRHGATATHDAISCRSCRLRVLFPKEIKTYGELRQMLAAKIDGKPV